MSSFRFVYQVTPPAIISRTYTVWSSTEHNKEQMLVEALKILRENVASPFFDGCSLCDFALHVMFFRKDNSSTYVGELSLLDDDTKEFTLYAFEEFVKHYDLKYYGRTDDV